jgi:protein-tyrosine phosphatase
MIHILFICAGNTCRSVLAEAMMRKTLMERPSLRERVRCKSAGLDAVEGAKAERGAATVAQQYDIDLSRHRARLLNARFVQDADLVLTMTTHQKDRAIERYPDCANYVYTLREFIQRFTPVESNRRQNPIVREIMAMNHEPPHDLDILDPMGQSIEAYQECARQIKAAIIALAELLEES